MAKRPPPPPVFELPDPIEETPPPRAPSPAPAPDADRAEFKDRKPAILRPRAYLAAGGCLVGALMLAPMIQTAKAQAEARADADDVLLIVRGLAVFFLLMAAGAAILQRRVAAGLVVLVALFAMHYLALDTPPYFIFRDVVWGVTPPLLLAMWHLAVGLDAPGRWTYVGSAAWVVGFAIKVLQLRGWRI